MSVRHIIIKTGEQRRTWAHFRSTILVLWLRAIAHIARLCATARIANRANLADDAPTIHSSVPNVVRLTVGGCALLGLTGCTSAQAPAFYIFGSYFPSWLIGTAVGIVLMVPIRWILIRLGIDDALPLRLLFYTCVVLVIAMAFSYTFSAQ